MTALQTEVSAASLTAMERRVLRLFSLGCSLSQVAAILGRSCPTIDNHKTRATRKLGVHKAAVLTRHIIKLGISPLEDELTEHERARLAQAAQQVRQDPHDFQGKPLRSTSGSRHNGSERYSHRGADT